MIRRTFTPAVLAALPALFLSNTAALAQDEAPPLTVFDGDYLTVGVGLAYGPSYEGSDAYIAYPVAGLQGRLAGFTLSPRPAGVAVDLINEPRDSRIGFTFGPVVRGRLDRTKQIRDPAVMALGTRDMAIEVGGTAGISLSGLTNPYDSLSFGVDVRKDVAGAHGGLVVQPTATFLTPLSRSMGIAVNLSADHVDDDYARYYFDVTPAGAVASGLPTYAARGGWKSTSASLVGMLDLDGDLANGGFTLVGGVSYSRLLGNFARSPIVSLRGDRDQFLMGAGLAFTF